MKQIVKRKVRRVRRAGAGVESAWKRDADLVERIDALVARIDRVTDPRSRPPLAQ